MNTKLRRLIYGASVLVTTGAFVGLATVGASAASNSQTFQANLAKVNNSGASGKLTVTLNGDQATINETVNGVLKGQPHAQHLHWSSSATHTCPTEAQATTQGGYKFITLSDAAPDYGAVDVSLTTGNNDTSPKAGLAVADYPTAPNGTINYHRTITLTSDQVQHLTSGQYVAVVHGIDLDGNGKYDASAGGVSQFAANAGVPNVPREATAPAACGIVEAASTTSQPTSTASTNTDNNDNGNNDVAIDIALGLGALGTLLGLISLATAGRRRV